MPKDPSPLTEAATQFEAELAIYARLGELFIKTPLTSLRHLERSNQTLGEIADCEQRLQDAGKRLIEALSGARSRQETLSSQVVAHAPTVQARNTQLQELMLEMGQLATDVAGVNAKIVQPEDKADPVDLSSSLITLSDRAEQLASAAHHAEFEELSQQAHALHQRLRAIGQKLQRAAAH